MPTSTYVPLATQTLSSTATSVTFSSIPATYRDLVVVCNFQNSGTSSASRLRLNLDTGANYSGVWMVGNGSTTASASEASQTGARIFGATLGPANTFSNVGIIQVIDYSATDKHKTVLTRYGSAGTDIQATASRWANTAAVTAVTIFDVLGQTYSIGSTFSLYAIAS